jgi:hypothetical protein
MAQNKQQVKQSPSVKYTALSEFGVTDEFGDTANYVAGDEFEPGAKWAEIPNSPGDNTNAVKFSVPYVTNPEAKKEDRLVSARTMILPVRKVLVTEE